MKWRIIQVVNANIPTYKLQTRLSGLLGKIIGWRTEKAANFSELGTAEDMLFTNKEAIKGYLKNTYSKYEIVVDQGEL
jgi:hypothetical protein